MRINVWHFYSEEEAYFEIITEEGAYFTSQHISNLLNLEIDKYNEILIEKVIQHNDYHIDKFPDFVLGEKKDLSFCLNDVSKEIYIERFKETFADQLTLLSLGGI